MVRPRTFAVLRLMANSILELTSMGIVAGLMPLMILSTDAPPDARKRQFGAVADQTSPLP